MAFEITTHDDYVRIEFFDGLDYWEVLEAIGKLMSVSEADHKNDLWIFRDGQLSFSYTDLYKIKEIIQANYPSDATGTRSAVVAGNGVQKGLADLYREIGRDLPREIRVFSALAAAEDWVKNGNREGRGRNKVP